MVGRKWYALSGLAFVVVALVGVIAFGGNSPDANASAAKVVSYYQAHTTRQIIAAFLLAASVPFLVVFGLYLGSLAPDAPGDRRRIWRRMVIAGATLEAATLLAAALVHFALADAVDQGVTGDAARALNFLDGDSWIAWNSALGVMMLGAGAAVLAAAVPLPRWLGWSALVFGVFLFIPFADFVALLLSLVWIIVCSVYLYWAGDDAVVAARSPAEV